MFKFFKRRLYLQIFATVILGLVLVVVLTGMLFAVLEREGYDERISNITKQLTYRALAPASASREEQEKSLFTLVEGSRLHVSLFDRDRKLIAAYGKRIPPPPANASTDGWSKHRGVRGWAPVWVGALPDKRWLAVDMSHGSRANPYIGIPLIIAVIGLAIALASYPLVRKLTGRLERLQEAVQAVGSGDLSRRVEVEGMDEVAQVASSFNAATDKIQSLLNTNRQLLAHASHELRTPLARVRLGVEMLKNKPDEKRQAALEHDIAELDDLIDEILLMSRLDTGQSAQAWENVDLLALASEECARYENCELTGSSTEVIGDARLLRRAVRNLLENAMKHGEPPVRMHVTCDDSSATITVKDAGNGIPKDLRSTIFQPFQRAPGKQNVPGYGLGLSLVSQIAKAHGGEIEIIDANDSESTMQLTVAVSPAGSEKH